MEKNCYMQGRKWSYDHNVDPDGYDVVTNMIVIDGITVIDGKEYVITANAPQPPIYGVESQVVSIHQGAAIKAHYKEYNYITDKYEENIEVTSEMHINSEQYIPPTKEEINTVDKDGKLNHDWYNNDYKRNIMSIEMIGNMKFESTFPSYNYRPLEA